jgi:acyl carrier protein
LEILIFLRESIVELQDFVAKFAEQFDETPASEFRAGTEFKALDEWSSMFALSIIAMVDDEYDVTLKGDDIRNSETIEDLYNRVKDRE